MHRIGRTGRAGATGIAVSLAHHADRGALRPIERYTGTSIPECDSGARAASTRSESSAPGSAQARTRGTASRRSGRLPRQAALVDGAF